jgi:hypothetical protein
MALTATALLVVLVGHQTRTSGFAAPFGTLCAGGERVSIPVAWAIERWHHSGLRVNV